MCAAKQSKTTSSSNSSATAVNSAVSALIDHSAETSHHSVCSTSLNNLLGKRGRSGDISAADKDEVNNITDDHDLEDSDSDGDDVDKRERR